MDHVIKDISMTRARIPLRFFLFERSSLKRSFLKILAPYDITAREELKNTAATPPLRVVDTIL